MKQLRKACAAVAAGLLFVSSAWAGTVAYPSAQDASFIVDHPDSWEVVPGEQLGDYVTLNSPSGAVLQLRTIPGTEDAVSQASAETVDYLNETFSNVQLGEAQDVEQGKLAGSLITGKGVDGDGQNVGFAIFFIALPDGKMADIWYAVVEGDTQGHSDAVNILNSLRAP